MEVQHLPECPLLDYCETTSMTEPRAQPVQHDVAVKQDRRIERTKGLLRSALAVLIQEMDYDAISVKHILERANVGRSTFYMHYRDKDELLASSFLGMMHGLQRKQKQRGHPVISFSQPLFEHIHAHVGDSKGDIGGKGRAALHEHLHAAVGEMIAQNVSREASRKSKHGGAVPQDLLVSYLASTFILVLNDWLRNQRKWTPAEANAVFEQLVLPVISPKKG
jgi:AcrR family transcriptional regulator